MSEPTSELILNARQADLGHGLTVLRILPSVRQRMVGPFIFLDHAGPVTLPAHVGRDADVRPHPHIGLATVSYLLSGEVMHRDSLGVEQAIRPGEVNWMTAGRGIVHSERFEGPAAFAGGGLELLQSWVALPDHAEEDPPAFDHYPIDNLPTAEEDGAWLRLIAGDAYGLRSDVKTHSPLFYLHAQLQPGARLALPTGHPERAAYIVNGSVEIAGHTYHRGQMIVFGAHHPANLRAVEPTTLMLLGGDPVGERFIWWNFVSSSHERIEQAKADWQAGRFALPPTDHDDLIPLPTDR
jgi:redox-sensitive bicupin YhaK (pirin superfamily)